VISPYVKKFEVLVPSRLALTNLNRGWRVIRENTRGVKVNMGLLRQTKPKGIHHDPTKLAPNMTIRPGDEATSRI